MVIVAQLCNVGLSSCGFIVVRPIFEVMMDLAVIRNYGNTSCKFNRVAMAFFAEMFDLLSVVSPRFHSPISWQLCTSLAFSVLCLQLLVDVLTLLNAPGYFLFIVFSDERFVWTNFCLDKLSNWIVDDVGNR